jgi:spermidine synthase
MTDTWATGAWEYVERARAASGPPRHSEVVLRERRAAAGGAAALELRVNGVFVMDTVETGTERRLARVALAAVEQPRDVLVGGLGLGFTAHEVLADDRVEHVVVVEVEAALVGWMRDGTVPHGPAYLDDERLQVVTADVRQVVAEAGRASYDLVLLDVDNGPGFLVHDANAAVYGRTFLGDVAALLRPGGAVAVWSAAEAPQLAAELSAVLATVTPMPFDVRLQGRDERYWLYLARGHRRRRR